MKNLCRSVLILEVVLEIDATNGLNLGGEKFYNLTFLSNTVLCVWFKHNCSLKILTYLQSNQGLGIEISSNHTVDGCNSLALHVAESPLSLKKYDQRLS